MHRKSNFFNAKNGDLTYPKMQVRLSRWDVRKEKIISRIEGGWLDCFSMGCRVTCFKQARKCLALKRCQVPAAFDLPRWIRQTEQAGASSTLYKSSTPLCTMLQHNETNILGERKTLAFVSFGRRESLVAVLFELQVRRAISIVKKNWNGMSEIGLGGNNTEESFRPQSTAAQPAPKRNHLLLKRLRSLLSSTHRWDRGTTGAISSKIFFPMHVNFGSPFSAGSNFGATLSEKASFFTKTCNT